MQRRGKRFVADWKDASGKRHRKAFVLERDARRFEQKMIATSKLSFELGQRIGRGIRPSIKGSARVREVRRLVDECSKIATIAALGKKPSSSLFLNSALKSA